MALSQKGAQGEEVEIPTDKGPTFGNLAIPDGSTGIVLFAHGSGSGRHSPRNNYVAQVLRDAGLATFMMDLLTEDEERVDMRTREFRFDIDLLAERLELATEWLNDHDEAGALQTGYFGSSTGAAAAIKAAAGRDDTHAIVSRGGRVDLGEEALPNFTAPILMIVGGNDRQVLQMNKDAMQQMNAPTELKIVEGAGHLFEGPGELEEVADLAADWFTRHLGA
ncbi:MAG: alpha/beta hydrolase [Armatimonadia bacterium]|nr:alpha/beta hydrolase [Armatimonadia bacterium]